MANNMYIISFILSNLYFAFGLFMFDREKLMDWKCGIVRQILQFLQ